LRRFVGAMLIVAAVLSACGSDGPSPDPQSGITGATMECWVADHGRCDPAARALALRPEIGGAPQHITVSERFCDGPCPGFGPADWSGHVLVEYLADREPANLVFEVIEGAFTWEVIPTVMHRAVPRSTPRGLGPIDIELGHCGLGSGIDIEGSFWDPVGIVDIAHPDAVNAAEARFTLTGPRTARLETRGGLSLNLVRHIGPKYLMLCM